jgi:NADH-quinone oxidoreductase subunit D
MRVMLTELTRLNSHLVWLGTHAIDIGAMSVFLYCFREREDILRIFEMFSGQRMMTSYFRIGGLALPPPRGWQKRVKDFVDISVARRRVRRTADQQSIWMGRTKGRRLHFARRHAGSGRDRPDAARRGPEDRRPQRRAVFQLRKFDFEVPTRTEERRVRALPGARRRDAAESTKIIRQALEGMPSGSHQADAPGIVLPDREKMKTQMEALIYHFKIVTEGFRVPAGEVYQVIESPRGEVGCYMVSDGTQKPYRVHWRGPSFGNLQAIPRMIEGTLIADVIAALGSMDFVLGDTDR